jgi:NAD dependent epimerase/dehydratase family enzyme
MDVYDKIKELELQSRKLEQENTTLQSTLEDTQTELTTLKRYKEETIWRITEEDFLSVLVDKFPDMSEPDRDAMINTAFSKFYLENWTGDVEDFVESRRERYEI